MNKTKDTVIAYHINKKFKSDIDPFTDLLACSHSELLSLAMMEFIQNHQKEFFTPKMKNQEIQKIVELSTQLLEKYGIDFSKNKTLRSKPGRGSIYPNMNKKTDNDFLPINHYLY